MDGTLHMLWSITIAIDSQAYPLSVVRKTAYALAETLSILIQPSESSLELLVTPTGSTSSLSEDAARILLIRTLNDFVLRDLVFQETSGIRELLARAALKEAGV